MGSLARALRRVPDIVRATGAVALSWVVLLFVGDPLFRSLDRALWRAAHAGWFDGWMGLRQGLGDAAWHGVRVSTGIPTFGLLVAATLAIPLTLLVRMVTRARLRAGLADPVAGTRDWMAAHPRAIRAAMALPALHWLVAMLRGVARQAHWNAHGDPFYYAVVAGLVAGTAGLAYGVYRVTEAILWMVLAPSRIPERTPVALVDERVQFNAVAVTRETRAAVAGMALLPIVTFLAIQLAALHDRATVMVLSAYVACAAWGAFAFRRASRVAVGVDGVFVSGSSRTRFFAYKDLDEACAAGSELELRRRGATVLRLQLHGEDATLKASVLRRLVEAIANARATARDVTSQVVNATSEEGLAHLANGGGDYRAPAVTRERLWGVVEGAHDATTRTHAARALAATERDGDRARLRAVAERCAEPKVRVSLRELATDEGDEEDEQDGGVSVAASRASPQLP